MNNPHANDVVSLTLAAGRPSQTVIDLLEDMLSLARKGEITCIGIARVSPGGHISSAIASSGTPHAPHLVTGALYLLREAERNIGIIP